MSNQFKKLLDKWYKKLEKDGFHDIEDLRAADQITRATGKLVEPPLKEWHSLKFLNKPVKQEIYKEYYEHAGHFLFENKFDSNYDKIIWEMHSKGLPVREIASKLKATKISPHNKSSVHRTVKRLSTQMIERYYGTSKRTCSNKTRD